MVRMFIRTLKWEAIYHLKIMRWVLPPLIALWMLLMLRSVVGSRDFATPTALWITRRDVLTLFAWLGYLISFSLIAAYPSHKTAYIDKTSLPMRLVSRPFGFVLAAKFLCNIIVVLIGAVMTELFAIAWDRLGLESSEFISLFAGSNAPNFVFVLYFTVLAAPAFLIMIAAIGMSGAQALLAVFDTTGKTITGIFTTVIIPIIAIATAFLLAYIGFRIFQQGFTDTPLHMLAGVSITILPIAMLWLAAWLYDNKGDMTSL